MGVLVLNYFHLCDLLLDQIVLVLVLVSYGENAIVHASHLKRFTIDT